jgi:glutathione S-transferase
MSLTIYGIPRSRAFRVLWAAEELRLAYRNVPVNFTDGVKTLEFLAVNPNGRIPAIDDDGFVLWESLAITLYLAKKHGLGTLYPGALENEARALQWSFWGANEIEMPLIQLVFNRYVYAPEKRSEAVAAEAEAKLPRPLGVLDAHLAKHATLLGGEFSIADLNVAALLYSAWFNKVDFTRWRHVKAWLDTCLTRTAALRARRLRES